MVVYRGGIIGATAGVATFSINASTGAATFAGLLSAPTGSIGGWTIGASTLSAVSGGNTTTLSSGATSFLPVLRVCQPSQSRRRVLSPQQGLSSMERQR